MKYTSIYSHLLFLLAFQQINFSKSESNSKNAEEKLPPPKKQDVPRLITPQERDILLELIKADNHNEIVTFFNTNNLIDYPLIRFQSADDSVNGYTPLAAAIRHCSKNSAIVLAPLQFTYPWTVTVAPCHSLPEIATKYCPSLLIETIEKSQMDFPLASMIQELEFSQITEIASILLDNSNNMKTEEKDKISQWIESFFNLNFNEQINEIFNEEGNKKKTKKMYSDAKLLIQKWIESGREIKPLIQIFKNQNVLPLYALASIELIKAGKPDEFLEIFNELNSDQQLKIDTFRKAALHITSEHLSSFDDKFKSDLTHYFRSLDMDIQFEYFDKSTDLLVSNTPYMYSVVSGNEDGSIMNLGNLDPLKLLANAAKLMKAMQKKLSGIVELDPKEATAIIQGANKMIPYAYSHFIKRFPHINTVIDLFPLNQIQVIWMGNDKSIDLEKEFTDFTKELIHAYTVDNADELENLLSNTNWINKSPEEIRFHFPPYNLSMIKTAVMLNKPKIFKYLMTLPNFSLHATSKHQLTALEMAACYQPKFLVAHIIPIIGKSCKQRLRAANNLIAMFKEGKLFQRCPTGDKNALKVLPKLLNFNDGNDVACINFDKRDFVEEAFKYNFPAELIKALYGTGKYTKNDFYIALAVRRGDPDLFNFFASIKTSDKPSYATEESLATWVRSSDGLLNDKNVKMLENLIKHKDVKLNAKMKDSGVSALSLAVQRSFTWIVKRLLLEKDLDINITDLNTLTTPIQHSINIFRTFIFEDQLTLPLLVRIAYNIAKYFDFGLNKSDIHTEVGSFMAWLKKTKVEDLVTDSSLQQIIQAALNDLRMNNYIKRIQNKNCHESMPIFLEILNDLVKKLSDIENKLKNENSAINTAIDLKYNSKAISYEFVKFAIIYCRDLFQETFVKLGEIRGLDFNQKSGKYSANSGLMHNILLSHPGIDTTIENAASIDTLHIAKKRALYLVGDDDGLDEMARTHVRVRNVDAIYGGKNYKLIAFGVVSTLIVGTVSAGIIRLII